MKKTVWKWFPIFIFFACFAGKQQAVSQIKVEYDSEISEITITNRSGQDIVWIRDDIGKNAAAKNSFDLSIVKKMEPAGIALSDYYITMPNKRTLTFKNIKTKPDKIVYYTYKIVNGLFQLSEKKEVLSKDFETPKIQEEPPKKQEEPAKPEDNLSNVLETTPVTPATPQETKPTQTTQTPSTTTTTTKTKATTPATPVVVKNPNREKIDKLFDESRELLAKSKEGVTADEKDILRNIEKRVTTLRNRIEREQNDLEVKKSNKKVKCNDCEELIRFASESMAELDYLNAKIHRILASLTDIEIENLKKEYRDEVLQTISQDALNLDYVKKEIEKRTKSSLWGWKGVSKVKNKLETIKKDFQQITDKSNAFIQRKLQSYSDDYDRAVIIDLNKEIPIDQKDITDCEKELDRISVPYGKLSLIVIVFLLLLTGVGLYLKTVYMNKQEEKIKEEKKISGESGLLIEEDYTVEVVSYNVGIKDIKEKPGDYYKVDMDTIFDDTTIRNVYFSKKAILDIYKFFSAFLRYDDKTNETGCFLVGRWEYVPNSNNQRYDISIESVIEPSDDAVYGEYALNFGAKIGITLNFAIEKLCEKTGNEYVHTAWMHSHPGLGLFLSSQDLSVQSQLAHSQHFGRMLAIVLDSNSPDFQTAFFTPKMNKTMNNDKEVKQLLSFEAMYQWAKKSPVQEIQAQPVPAPAAPQNNYSVDVVSKKNTINKVSISASAIIDMDMAIMPDATGLQGYISGMLKDKELLLNDFEEYVGEATTKKETVACFCVVPQFDMKKISTDADLSKLIKEYQFAVFYALNDEKIHIISKDELLISISLQEMKEWTRRKR